MQIPARLIQIICPKYPRPARLSDESLLLFWDNYFEKCGIE